MDNLTPTPKEECRINAIEIQHKIEMAQDNLFEMLTNQDAHPRYWHLSNLVTLFKEINDLAEKIEDLSGN